MVLSYLRRYFQKEADQELDQLAVQAGTDKSSRGHHYTAIYAHWFAPLRNKPLKFLEIGVQFGYSIRLWENYFKRGELHFIDLDFSYLIHQPGKRSHLHVANQEDPIALKALAEQIGHFDIIIDDGGHTMAQQQVSFETLFPFVSPGGLYIIEDLHTSYWTAYGGGGTMYQPQPSPQSTTEYLKKKIDALNVEAAKKGKAMGNHPIRSIAFYEGLCILAKR